MADSNGRLPRCKREGTASEVLAAQEVAATPPAACTAACTRIPEEGNGGALEADPADVGRGPSAAGAPAAGAPTDQGDPVAKLAAAMLNLSPADRERLAAMLAGQQGNGGDA